MSKRKPVLYAAKVIQLDPMDCGSTVGYSITRKRWGGLCATLDLTDCVHKIAWEFDENDAEKAAIVASIFSEFRDAFDAALIKYKRNRKKKN